MQVSEKMVGQCPECNAEVIEKEIMETVGQYSEGLKSIGPGLHGQVRLIKKSKIFCPKCKTVFA